MTKEELNKVLNDTQGEQSQIRAAHILVKLLADEGVLNFLCDTAIRTDNHNVRATIILALKASSLRNEANAYFIDCASTSPEPLYRKWALTNLNSTACNTAKNAFLKGLRDSHFSVRVAAALNAEHYYDEDEMRALKRIFKINKFNLFLDRMITAAKRLIKKLLKCIENDLRDSKNTEVPYTW